MTPAEILKSNRVIADFMGYFPSGTQYIDSMEIENLKYHMSWDRVMPVVKKIAGLLLNKDWEDLQEATKRWKPIENELLKGSKDNVYFCVVKFIEWYNGATDGRAAIA